jgi:hypothetical protein
VGDPTGEKEPPRGPAPQTAPQTAPQSKLRYTKSLDEAVKGLKLRPPPRAYKYNPHIEKL